MSARVGGKVNATVKSRSKRAGLQFPVGRIHRYLRNGKYANRIGVGGPIYLAAVLEYLTAEVRFPLNNNLLYQYNNPRKYSIRCP